MLLSKLLNNNQLKKVKKLKRKSNQAFKSLKNKSNQNNNNLKSVNLSLKMPMSSPNSIYKIWSHEENCHQISLRTLHNKIEDWDISMSQLKIKFTFIDLYLISKTLTLISMTDLLYGTSYWTKVFQLKTQIIKSSAQDLVSILQVSIQVLLLELMVLSTLFWVFHA